MIDENMGTRLTKEEKKLCKNMLWDLLRLEGKAAGKSLADEFGVDARVFSRWKQSGACNRDNFNRIAELHMQRVPQGKQESAMPVVDSPKAVNPTEGSAESSKPNVDKPNAPIVHSIDTTMGVLAAVRILASKGCFNLLYRILANNSDTETRAALDTILNAPIHQGDALDAKDLAWMENLTGETTKS